MVTSYSRQLQKPSASMVDHFNYFKSLERQLEEALAARHDHECILKRLNDQELRLSSLDRQLEHIEWQDSLSTSDSRLKTVERRLQSLQACYQSNIDESYHKIEDTMQGLTAKVDRQLTTLKLDSQKHLEKHCHEAHLTLTDRIQALETSVEEIHRKLRHIDTYAHKNNNNQTIHSLTVRVGGLETALNAVATHNKGVCESLVALEKAVCDLRTQQAIPPPQQHTNSSSPQNYKDRQLLLPEHRASCTTTSRKQNVDYTLQQIQLAKERLNRHHHHRLPSPISHNNDIDILHQTENQGSRRERLNEVYCRLKYSR